ncbi:MAG: hypothetical protein ACP5UM_12020 [Anaerolineae bacterium]
MAERALLRRGAGARERAGAWLRERGGLSLSTALMAIALATAVGSFYIYLVGYEARLHLQVRAAQEEAQALMSEITDLRRELAETESYMYVKPLLARQGMRDLAPEDCRYFLMLPEQGEGGRAAPEAPATGRAGGP